MSAALLAAALAQALVPVTFEAARAEQPRALAERLIGRDEAADVERSEIRWDRMLPGGAYLELFHRPIPFEDDMCARRVHTLLLMARPPAPGSSLDRAPLTIEHVDDDVGLALAPGCRTVAGQSFVVANQGLERAAFVQGLRDLSAARAAAAEPSRLPFRLTCNDAVRDHRNACRAGARRTLAALPIERAWQMESDSASVEIFVGGPGEQQWGVRISGFGTHEARVSLRWFEPPPF